MSVANALAIEGIDVAILGGDATGDNVAHEWETLRKPGVRLFQRGATRSGLVSRLRRGFLGVPLRATDVRPGNIVVLYNPGPIQYLLARRLSRKFEVRLIVDISEWLGAEDLPGGRASPYSWLYTIFMHGLPALLRRGGRAFAISSPMADYLSKYGARTLVVPPLSLAEPRSSNHDGHPRDSGDGPIRVIVTGSGLATGSKDARALDAVIEIAQHRPEMLAHIELDVVGELDYSASAALAELASVLSVVEHGRLGWGDTCGIVEASDWLLLLRDPNIRRHRLGYPSKVIEALALGVPVIVNRCGGVTDYLQDGTNAIILDGATEEDVVAALRRTRTDTPRRESDGRFVPEVWSEKLAAFVTEDL